MQFVMLPSSALIRILEHLPPETLGAAAATCSTSSLAFELPQLWRRLLLQADEGQSEAFVGESARELRQRYVREMDDTVRWRGSADLGSSPSHKITMLMLGDAFVGKTSFLHRLVYGAFDETGPSIVGFDYRSVACVHRRKAFELQVWDTAGSERFRHITSSFFRLVNVALCMFDISDRESFGHVPLFLRDIDNYCREGVLILLVGCKGDLSGQRRVSIDEAHALAEAHGVPQYLECSSKTGAGIQEVAEAAVRLFARPTSAPPGPPAPGQLATAHHQIERQCVRCTVM